MKKRIFITATNTDIGKTYTTKLLLREYASRGLKVGVIKPVETGVIDGVYPDGDALLALVHELNPAMKDLSVCDIVPISYGLPAAPFIASGGEKFDTEKVLKAIEKLETYCDVLLIEGAGGLYVPLDEELMILDLIKLTQASTLLITHCSLGCINDTLLSKKALEDAGIAHAVVFNPKESEGSFEEVSAPYFQAKDFSILKTSSDIDTLCDVLYNL
ncbi:MULTISPECIES: dethiobiotin synthase [Sulfurimonas]|uniref:dethiobiotin synthase n=1 Tax=Sulfurimonas TaxID=202746 RepID=UPI0012659C7A|nr:dethiobiotin synthase [Sulfurimonas indica]